MQQVDVVPKVNTPENIETLQSLDAVLKQVAENQKDLPVAIAANQAAGSIGAAQNLEAVNSLLAIAVTSKASPVTTPVVQLGGAATATASAVVSTTTAASKGGNRGGSGNARGNAGNNKNNKRALGGGLRWAKRYVLAGEQFTDEES